MHIEVDRDRCEANAVCEALAPEVFRVTEDDELIVLQAEPPPATLDRVRQAVLRCPRRALTLVD